MFDLLGRSKEMVGAEGSEELSDDDSENEESIGWKVNNTWLH